MSRRLLATGLFTVVLACVASGSAAAHTITPQAALTKAGQVARARGLATGANQYYAFGCQRRSTHVVDCVGAIVFPDGTGCAQVVRSAYASHASKAVSGRLIGQPLCGPTDDPDYPAPSGSGSGSGGGGETAICAIRSSVCISGN